MTSQKMTLKDKMNIISQKNSILKQAEADMAQAVSALTIPSAEGVNDSLSEGEAVVFAEDNSVFVFRNGQISRHSLVSLAIP